MKDRLEVASCSLAKRDAGEEVYKTEAAENDSHRSGTHAMSRRLLQMIQTMPHLMKLISSNKAVKCAATTAVCLVMHVRLDL